jgi:hypothetical protein
MFPPSILPEGRLRLCVKTNISFKALGGFFLLEKFGLEYFPVTTPHA